MTQMSPKTVDYPKIPIFETLSRSVRDFPDKPALFFLGGRSEQ